ncbi:hypothetical protein HPP92_028882 [Vanilla planifolia]|uniref:Uncharacterized protein n=1 Tax=Vanilla planifolia TaxID=51239 RepID=A0A835P5Q0_VANPL|nr:hypothetical protein HPP92_028882 [Vanilla planifolia]KAG0446361.1 hypothetical protein HPP92_028871 [Vanilla planifolia]
MVSSPVLLLPGNGVTGTEGSRGATMEDGGERGTEGSAHFFGMGGLTSEDDPEGEGETRTGGESHRFPEPAGTHERAYAGNAADEGTNIGRLCWLESLISDDAGLPRPKQNTLPKMTGPALFDLLNRAPVLSISHTIPSP